MAKAEGFEEKQTFIVSKDTDWSFLETSNENFDLFGAKKIIEVKMIGTGPGNKGSKAIKEYCSQPDENKLLIFSAEKLERKAQSSAWAKSLEDKGTSVVVDSKECSVKMFYNRWDGMHLAFQLKMLQ